MVLRKPFPAPNLTDVMENLLIRADINAQKKPIFVAHEFSAEQMDDLRETLDSVFVGTAFELYYADKEMKPGHILLGKISERIKTTEFEIYDLSRQGRLNVALELGIAIGLGKPYYITAREGSSIPSDLAGIDRIEYRSFQDLAIQLKDKVLTRYE